MTIRIGYSIGLKYRLNGAIETKVEWCKESDGRSLTSILKQLGNAQIIDLNQCVWKSQTDGKYSMMVGIVD